MKKEATADLESVLWARIGDPNAAVGALSLDAGRLLLTFGDVGGHPRTVLHIKGGQVVAIQPVFPKPASAKRGR